MLGVARACREEVGEGRTQITSGAELRSLDSEGNGELLQGLEQGREGTVFIFRWRPLATERKKGWNRQEVMVTWAEIGQRGWRKGDQPAFMPQCL